MGNGFSSAERRRFLSTGFIFFWLAVSWTTLLLGFPARAELPSKKIPPPHRSGELVVKARATGDALTSQAVVLEALNRRFGSRAVIGINPLVTDRKLSLVHLARDQDLPGAIAALKADPRVDYAEPNWVYRALDNGRPNDPDFDKLWGLKNTGQTDAFGQVGISGSDINVFPLWAKGITGSRGFLVAVIDTGVEWTHPDLMENIYTKPAGEVHEGFVDDIHGWNFFKNDSNSNDDNGHGSHCAGTIGAVGNNGQGIAGINWQITILPVKFLGSEGSGSLDAAVQSINYARMLKVQVMSNSWGGGGYSDALKEAISAAKDAGILFVAAAGNESSNNDLEPSYPASYALPNVLAVAATDNQDALASFSNFGRTTVHVAAPGVGIYSTVKGAAYATYSGTSMATPHVAGAAALIWSANPRWRFGLVKERLIATSDPIPSLRRRVLARGRINVANAYFGVVPSSPDPDEKLWQDVAQVVESPHPYDNDADLQYKIHYPGAKFLRIHFEKIAVEEKYDKVTVEDATGREFEQLTGKVSDYMTDYVKGDTIVVRLKSDASQTDYGFKIDKIQVILGSIR